MYTVFLTAYRSYEPKAVNEKMTVGMHATINAHPSVYGKVTARDVVGCYREAGAESASTERTLRVECTEAIQCEDLLYLAKQHFQDSILVVRNEDMSAELWSLEKPGDYIQYTPLEGTFKQVDEPSGECYSMIDGQCWEVA